MTDDLFSVSGKIALVTGDDGGAGALIAQALVEAGARVYLTSPDGVAAEKAAADLSLLGDCRSLAADVSSEAGCRSLAEEFGRVSDSVHILVNNAGGWPDTLLGNLEAAFHLTKFLRPQLAAASIPGDPARVVNVGSIDGLRVPAPETYSYDVSKAAMRHLTRDLADRLAPQIMVNAVALGPFISAMVERDRLRENGSLMRRGIDDIGGIVRFLGSRASAYITGTVVPVDGGTVLAR